MAQNPIQWFPGHMAKTRRQMKECLPLVDIVLELIDARIPYSSRNPELSELLGDKPRITVFTKYSLADPTLTKKWFDIYKYWFSILSDVNELHNSSYCFFNSLFSFSSCFNFFKFSS